MKILTTLFFLLSAFRCFAQGTQPHGAAVSSLDVTNINASILTGGDIFHDLSVLIPNQNNWYTQSFEVPRGSGKHSIFAGALWLGGKDPGGQIYTATQTYRQAYLGIPPQMSFWPGPIATSQTAAHSTHYDNIWKVSNAQIQYHIANYANPAYSMPAAIATWPGNGNTNNGEASQLAPFEDNNNDGIYSPDLGDFPKIKGEQALYLIMNDKGNIKAPASPSMNLEIHVMFYGFNDPLNTPVYNTIFSEYRIINRSQTNYNSFYAGIWTDFDLGNWADDRIGCDTINNRFYVYNGDSIDDGPLGYGTNPPIQSVKFLDQKMSHFIYYNNDANQVNGNPKISSDYYNYLRGYWRTNVPITYGGDGTNIQNPHANYMFPGNPVTKNGWSEVNTLTSSSWNSGDRRGMGSIGPYNLNAGQELKFTVAYTYTRRIVYPYLAICNFGPLDAQDVQTHFNNVVNSTKTERSKLPLLLFPNPATDQLTIQLPSAFENKIANLSITDNVGRKVLETPVGSNSGNQVQLNIEALRKGLYLVTVTSGEETVTTKLAKL